ncbi:MAG: hypothetical protein AB1405_03720 [Bdellovibrionota bacterium]
MTSNHPLPWHVETFNNTSGDHPYEEEGLVDADGGLVDVDMPENLERIALWSKGLASNGGLDLEAVLQRAENAERREKLVIDWVEGCRKEYQELLRRLHGAEAKIRSLEKSVGEGKR